MLLNKGNLKLKESSKAIVENLLHLHLSRNGSGKYGDAPPLRSELFSAEQMKQHGRRLAGLHKLSAGRAPDQLLSRLAENEEVLVVVHKLMIEAVAANRQITPAGEWLLDNFYLIGEQIRTAKRHLPKAYSRELPRLREGPSLGLPRVYDIALEVIAHGDGRVDPESLTSFVATYQAVTPLTLGELWALPIMLRLALIENLRRVSARVADDRIGRNRADDWADQLIETAEKVPKNLIVVIADLARSNPPIDSSFVAEVTRRLQGQGPSLTLPLTWLEQLLSESGTTIQQMVHSESQKQAANQVSMSNSIGSLRYLSAFDWRKFVESMSEVEQILREDTGEVYARMEFCTRDSYRHVVERIAKYSGHNEGEVARKAIELAQGAAALKGSADRGAHVGYYLVDEGVEQLELAVAARVPAGDRIGRWCHRSPVLLYVGGVALITLALTGLVVFKAQSSGINIWILGLIGALWMLAGSQLAVSIVNWLVTLLMTPRLLPRMDFSTGIPPDSRTLVVVPTMLLSLENVQELVEKLEVRFLANRDENLHFALLTDFRDAAEEVTPEDEPLLDLAVQGIADLNARYKSDGGTQFFLFHRPRRWNPQERLWMGYERKRGKLGDLNAFLRGGAEDTFSRIVGETASLSDVKFVITLDTDTQLPRDSGRHLVGAMAHPLNRAFYCEPVDRVCEGYGILQPRVGASLPGSNQSRYARLFGSEPGIDPYTRAVSDVYQDLAGEGSFIGKGIYDVDAFERALKGRFPDNRILSHDLIESCYARSGLLTDVQVYEEYPGQYSADVSRRHRWIRGDWQLLRWLTPWIPKGAEGRRNPISALSRWKIFDNLRRSVVPIALTVLFLLTWAVLPFPGLWTLAILGVVAIPSAIFCMMELLRKPREVLWRQHLTSTLRCASMHFSQVAFTLACLPYEAYVSLDAIVRTLWRMVVSRRLLEWRASGDGAGGSGPSLAGSWRTMWIGPAIAPAAMIYLTAARPSALLVAWPIWALWVMSPSIAWWISRPVPRREARITAEQRVFLRKLARKTWDFFESFVGPEDNWLPPDNYQEHPVARIARRTSPTNIGLSLLANLSAYDFGYITAGQFVERTASCFRTMQTLERFRGHFFNWYDTQSLKPLHPIYISTVDSGNLAANLLTLRPGLLAIADQAIVNPRWLEGLTDTFGILVAASGNSVPAELSDMPSVLAEARKSPLTAPRAIRLLLERLEAAASAAAKGPHRFDTRRWSRALAAQCRAALEEIAFLGSDDFEGIPTLREVAAMPGGAPHTLHARDRITAAESLALQAGEFAQMEYDFLFDRGRQLVTIGYNVTEHRADQSYYDLLASEARLGSFVAIAQGLIPQDNWFAMSRMLVAAGGEPMLLSWSGSMFEYLMPLVVMPTYENTLLDETYKAAVARQIEYGTQRGVPWGVSESGYNAVDAQLNYQYRAFGVPGTGLKRGLADDLVVAPYASALALMVAPEQACSNLEKLAKDGFEGTYGLYEAIDYTSSRVPRGQLHVVIRSFMAHHQGMSLLSFAHLLLDRPMQKRFASDPLFQATTLLLQERVPRAMALYSRLAESSDVRAAATGGETPVRVIRNTNTPTPELQLLSNGRYHVMITNTGGGYSRWNDLAVTRWREDGTCDNWGTFCYIRTLPSGEFWSSAFQPTLEPSDSYEAIFSDARAEFRRRDRGFDMHTEIAVSPEDDIELRRVSISNTSRSRKTIEVTSYAEVVMSSAAADALHPAFSNLFVQTEILRDQQAILCTRRPRSQDERPPWLCHLMTVHGASAGEASYETDRMRFIGRGNTVANPQAMTGTSALSNTEGAVLDPIIAIRRQISLEGGDIVTVDIVTGMAETREASLLLVEKYRDRRLADRVFDLAWTHSQVLLRQINATEADAQLYGQLAGAVVYANPAMRGDASVLVQNHRGQSGLWSYSISGDLPIVLLQVADMAHIELVRQLVQAQAYWRLKGLPVDLMIWNEDHSGYRQDLHDQILGLISAGADGIVKDRPGGIFVRPSEQVSQEDRVLFLSVARAVLSDGRGTLAEQVASDELEPSEAELAPVRAYRPARVVPAAPRRDLTFFNGLGGFTPDGREYIITTTQRQITPAPWVNVLANANFGTVVSEGGVAYTWAENAHEFRLTPWANDPVTDTGGEAYYLRDEETGDFWSPTPMPRRGAEPYVSRHGFGYSVFEHSEGGIRSETWVYVATDAAVKFTVIKIHNDSGRTRKLSATGYVQWVLGDLPPKTAMHVVTESEPGSGAIFARNAYNTTFSGRTAFFATSEMGVTVTGDRREFLGRNGTLGAPAAMTRSRLSGKIGAGMDPCAAMQAQFDLAPGEEHQVVFTLGAGATAEEARQLADRFRFGDSAYAALEAVWQYWKHTLGTVNVETPDASLNVLANGWLLYQTLACRFWARSGYYQSGGAFGFRDQLQDAMALVHAEPRLLREHLVLCASRQFREGDVQHWWHPPEGRGVRTHCSDDYLWLPLATCRYVSSTGDTGVLDESARFLEGRPVNEEEDSYYDLPARSEEAASLYEHCKRAILHGLRFGEHGLPLMGSGDWNDGMNLVGIHGKGESVWLGFFLHQVLEDFAMLASAHGDTEFAERCRREATQLSANIERDAWDGGWYRRAYFDDGKPLGSAENTECQIDSIAQSWSVLSGAGDGGRSRMAMQALNEHLVRRDRGLVQLLDPAFDKGDLNPGYIKGYLPGVRENGGQYTHSAVWATMAFARQGDRQLAWELFGIINPVNHGKSATAMATYKVEPYVVAADVYALSPHTGRGGWTWYTGSAGWMYRLITESLLGLRLEVDRLHIEPCLPAGWEGFKMHYRYRETVYHISILQGPGDARITVDGEVRTDQAIPLVDDRRDHNVEVRLGGK